MSPQSALRGASRSQARLNKSDQCSPFSWAAKDGSHWVLCNDTGVILVGRVLSRGAPIPFSNALLLILPSFLVLVAMVFAPSGHPRRLEAPGSTVVEAAKELCDVIDRYFGPLALWFGRVEWSLLDNRLEVAHHFAEIQTSDEVGQVDRVGADVSQGTAARNNFVETPEHGKIRAGRPILGAAGVNMKEASEAAFAH